MNPNASKATKAALKDSPARKIDGRKNNGGARAGAGRKPKAEEEQVETKQMHIDTPVPLLQEMDEAGILNRTAYVLELIRKDLKKRKK